VIGLSLRWRASPAPLKGGASLVDANGRQTLHLIEIAEPEAPSLVACGTIE